MKVFISHQLQDSNIASFVHRNFSLKGIESYLDVIDTHIKSGDVNMGPYIRKALGSCSHLLAVVSTNTVKSWWVPWEIGVATEKDYPICTFAADDTVIPEYLLTWPYLKTIAQLDTYINIAKEVERSKTPLQEQMEKGFRVKTASAPSYSQTFHTRLKSALNQ